MLSFAIAGAEGACVFQEDVVCFKGFSAWEVLARNFFVGLCRKGEKKMCRICTFASRPQSFPVELI